MIYLEIRALLHPLIKPIQEIEGNGRPSAVEDKTNAANINFVPYAQNEIFRYV